MKITDTGQILNTRISFYGKHRFSNMAEKLSPRDIYSDTVSEEFIELRKIYNNLWEKMDLPKNLKPRLQYQAMLSNMAFSFENYSIYVEKRLSPFRMNLRNKTGMNESILRHEIEHTKQFWDIIRLIGADNMAKKFNNIGWLHIDFNPSLIKKMHEIENTLGRILPDSKEYIRAQQHLEALKKYPNIGQYEGIGIAELIKRFRYKYNMLEREANKQAAKYEPSYLKTIKTAVKEFFKLLKY